MSGSAGPLPTWWDACSAIDAAAESERQVMAAVDAVARFSAGWPEEVVVTELQRELDRRAVTGRSVEGSALTVLADEVLYRSARAEG